ncbi:MAG: ATP-binding protein [Rhodospirillales bacterium]
MSEPNKTANRELGYFANYVKRSVTISAVRFDELECSRIGFKQDFVSFLANGNDGVLRSRSNEKGVLGSSQWLPNIFGIGVELDPEAPKIFRTTVKDSGGGIPADIIEKVGQPCFTTRSCVGSAGLGLAISRATGESLKGMIEVSNAGRGARFVVSLPIYTTAEAVPVSA